MSFIYEKRYFALSLLTIWNLANSIEQVKGLAMVDATWICISGRRCAAMRAPCWYFIFAWASPLPSYLFGQCESLNLWDGDESDSHAFPFYNLTYSIAGESSGRRGFKHKWKDKQNTTLYCDSLSVG